MKLYACLGAEARERNFKNILFLVKERNLGGKFVWKICSFGPTSGFYLLVTHVEPHLKLFLLSAFS